LMLDQQELQECSFCILVIFVVNSWCFGVKPLIITVCFPNAQFIQDRPELNPIKGF